MYLMYQPNWIFRSKKHSKSIVQIGLASQKKTSVEVFWWWCLNQNELFDWQYSLFCLRSGRTGYRAFKHRHRLVARERHNDTNVHLHLPHIGDRRCRKSWKQSPLVNREKILEEIFELPLQKLHELKGGRKNRIFKRGVFLLFRWGSCPEIPLFLGFWDFWKNWYQFPVQWSFPHPWR